MHQCWLQFSFNLEFVSFGAVILWISKKKKFDKSGKFFSMFKLCLFCLLVLVQCVYLMFQNLCKICFFLQNLLIFEEKNFIFFANCEIDIEKKISKMRTIAITRISSIRILFYKWMFESSLCASCLGWIFFKILSESLRK